MNLIRCLGNSKAVGNLLDIFGRHQMFFRRKNVGGIVPIGQNNIAVTRRDFHVVGKCFEDVVVDANLYIILASELPVVVEILRFH